VPASEKLTIETPEQIALEFPLASAGSRFLALAIDTFIQAAGFLLLALVAWAASLVRASGAPSFGNWVLAILVLFAFLLYYGYYAGFEALWNGQTPGKRIVGLRVLTTSGRPISAYDSLLRNLLRIVDQLPGIYTVGLLAIFFTERNQRLGDLAADTVVVHEHPIDVAPAVPSATTIATPRGAGRLSAEELRVIETFLSRRNDLDDDIRRRSAHTLAERVRARLQIAATDSVSDETLLEQIAAEARGGWR
jgi:uncharacterized RDD family membrane protein YckC